VGFEVSNGSVLKYCCTLQSVKVWLGMAFVVVEWGFA